MLFRSGKAGSVQFVLSVTKPAMKGMVPGVPIVAAEGSAGRRRVEAAFKGGVYQNAVDYRATMYDNVGPLVRINRYPSSTSLAGECIVSAIIQCGPNLALRFGYQGLWMSEIGLAPNQANQSDFFTGAGSDDFEGLSFNGGFVGLEANW